MGSAQTIPTVNGPKNWSPTTKKILLYEESMDSVRIGRGFISQPNLRRNLRKQAYG